MKWWHNTIKKLQDSNHTFEDIYKIIFNNENKIFAEYMDKSELVSMTYGECNNLISQYTNTLNYLLHDKRANSFIAIYLDNCPEWLAIFFSILKSGFRPLLLNTKTSHLNTMKIIETTKPILIISKDVKIDFHVKTINISVLSETHESFTFFPWANEMTLCSTGTTGIPKVVTYDGESLCYGLYHSDFVFANNVHIGCSYKGIRKHLAFLPFYHVFGLIAVLLWYAIYGDTFVFTFDQRPEAIMKLCRDLNVTHLYAVPVFWNTIAKYISTKYNEKNTLNEKLEKSINIQAKNNLLGRRLISTSLFKNERKLTFGDSLQYAINGAGYIYNDTIKIINALGYPLYNGFGMTEIGITSVELEYPIKTRLQCSIGIPFANVEYDVIPLGKQANDMTTGELVVRSKSISKAIYFDDTIINNNKDDWFHTGDIVNRTKEGKYFIHGKIKDIIVNESGENIFPNDIEINFNIDGIINQCVVGITNKNGYDDIYLVVQIDPEMPSYRIRKILGKINEINNSLPNQYQVKRFLFTVDALPTAMGIKIRRNILKEEIESNRFKYFEYNLSHYQTREEITSENMKELIQQIKEIFKDVLNVESSQINDYSHFIFDLGGNSLNYYTLVSEIEQKFKIKYNLDGESLCTSPYDFAVYIEKH